MAKKEPRRFGVLLYLWLVAAEVADADHCDIIGLLCACGEFGDVLCDDGADRLGDAVFT